MISFIIGTLGRAPSSMKGPQKDTLTCSYRFFSTLTIIYRLVLFFILVTAVKKIKPDFNVFWSYLTFLGAERESLALRNSPKGHKLNK